MLFDLPATIMGFREGLEAFLVIALILGYLNQVEKHHLKINSYIGSGLGVVFSIFLGLGLFYVSDAIGGADKVSKAWESIASLVALVLITTFIIWMITKGSQMTANVRNQVANNLSPIGISIVAFVMIAREGTEVAIFTFAGKYDLTSVLIGIFIALVIAVLIYKSILRIPLDLIFKITLAYLILQAGFLFGYSIHEGLSALKAYDVIAGDSWLFSKAFDVSNTIFGHKNGVLGIPLFVTTGWYSKPEWIQLVIHYGYVLFMFVFWLKTNCKLCQSTRIHPQ